MTRGIAGQKIRLIVEDTASDKAQTYTLASKMIARDDILALPVSNSVER